MPLRLSSRADFTLANFQRVAWEGDGAVFAKSALRRMAQTRRQFLALLDSDPEITIYGVTSGYGQMASKRLTPAERKKHARTPPHGSMVAFGIPVPERVARGIVFARLANYIEGHAAISPDLAAAVAELLDGRKLPAVSMEGQGGAGEILGLMAAMSGIPYEVSAETLHPCQVAFVRSDDFMGFIAKHPEAYQGVVRQLSTHYSGACEQLRTVGLSASAPEKLARLLLDWFPEANGIKPGTPTKLPLTHEEIAEFIGTSRETVTRTLSEFKSRQLVALQGSTLMISNRPALETIGAGE